MDDRRETNTNIEGGVVDDVDFLLLMEESRTTWDV